MPFFLRIVTAAFLVVTLLGAGPAWATEPKKAPGTDKNQPVHVEADRMVSVREENAVHFTGKVEARQGSLIIHSDEMTIYYLSAEEKSALPPGVGGQLKKLFATGRVRIQGEDWTASGDRMEYFEKDRRVLLSGNSKVWQNNNLVTGESVLIYLDDGKSIVERSGKPNERVKAFFYSDDGGSAGKKK